MFGANKINGKYYAISRQNKYKQKYVKLVFLKNEIWNWCCEALNKNNELLFN